jgi:ribonucleoside-triphosphate reductase
MIVIKRNGEKVDYDLEKISIAIAAAFEELGEVFEDDDVLHNIDFTIQTSHPESIGVEEIQDIVEEALWNNGYYRQGRLYTRYRYDRELDRLNAEQREVDAKLRGANIENQNANIDEMSFGGRKGEASNVVMKDYALNHCMSKMSRNNHLNNEIYIHDLDSYAVGMHNCSARETKFITDSGVESFENMEDNDIVTVLTHTGEWKQAIVHSYGKQQLNKITFSRAGQRFVTERFTSNHRWLLEDGTITENLKIGDRILKAPMINEFDFDTATEQEKYYWCLGFVLGDGTEAYRWSHGKKYKNIKFVRMRLCNDKVKYEPRFINLQHSTKEMDNGDLYLTFSSTINFRKIFPDLSVMSWKEKLALFDGLYCADGQKTGSKKTILTTNEQIASFIEDVVPSLGYYIINIKDKTGEQTNYKKRGFTKEYTFIGDSNKYYWTVVDIQSDKEEEVWCLDVQDNHSFVLPNGIVTGNCLSIPFDDLLANGFNTRQTDVRPANSVNTAMQLVAVIFQLQSLQQFGGVSATHIDWTMVPYVRKSFYKHYKDGIKYLSDDEEMLQELSDSLPIDDDKYKQNLKVYNYALEKTEQEVHQGAEGLFHNLNTLQSRSGNQLPFTSINFGTCTKPEGRMVIKALLEVSIEGLGKLHKTSIFPCSIFQCMKGVNRKPGEPNYDLFQLALQSTAKRLYPNYANVDWTGNEGYDINDPRTYFSTMGCRTANGYDINGFGQLKDGRGNICPVTIIMPTLAMEVDGDTEKFMRLLDTKIHEAKDMLIERFEYICAQPPESAKFMYENNTMAGYIPEEGIRSALKHGTLAIGMIAMAETLQILIGQDQTTEEGMVLAKRICQLFKDRCAEFKEQYKLNFGVYFTPAENLCYTSMKKFQNKYGKIKNVSEREFFTNSVHVPVWTEISAFEKIDIESQLDGYSSAGCILYTELDGTVEHNLEGLETLVNYAMDKDVPYFAVNVPNDTCLNCGYTAELNDTCPMCGGTDIQRLRRVTGYLTGNYTTAFNPGKQSEVEVRYKNGKGKVIKVDNEIC